MKTTKKISLRYTLLGDGSSDRALMPVLEWLIYQIAGSMPVEGMWADPAQSPIKLQSLRERLLFALDYFPCDILFVHRDAEAQAPSKRHDEINEGVLQVSHVLHSAPARVVAVVPVRMMEAWFLINSDAIRFAAGNPNGNESFKLPKTKSIEGIADPKALLHQCILEASGLEGRRRKKINIYHSVQRVAGAISDFTPLLSLKSFQKLRDDLTVVLRDLGYFE